MKIHLSKKIIILLIVVAVVIIAWFFITNSKSNNEHTFYIVERGAVSQEISETGTVKKGDKISLSFKSAGQLKQVYVETGDEVNKGTLLAKLDNTQLYIQLEQAEADLQLTQAELDKLLAGATKEEIQVAQTSVDNAQTSLENEKKDLENVQAGIAQDIEDVYEDAFDTLNDSYLKLYNASTLIKSIQASYFTSNDQDSLNVKENKSKLEDSLDEMDFYLVQVKTNFTEQNVDFALVDFESNLADSRDCLSKIRGIIEGASYRNVVSSSDKTSLDTHRANINTAYSNIIGEQQDIASVKLANKTDLDTAESAVSAAQDALRTAENNLALVTAEPRQEDISLYQAKVKSAQAKVDIFESQIRDTILRSPIEGVITTVDKFAGETVSAVSPIISILPAEVLEIKVDIYEEDIVKIEEGNFVRIVLVAFPEEIFEGIVVFAEPVEKLIDGVVYYEITINFETAPEGVKPGMSADVSIITASRDNVLRIPEETIVIEDGKSFVSVMIDEEIKEREIEIGLEGVDDMVEVVAGIEEGEKIVID